VGAGHSFTGLALTDGRLVRLDRHARVLQVDRERRRVTVQAGIPLWRLNRTLERFGLALPNLGDIAYQSVAGAISTATHGTGARFGGLATQVVGMRLVCADGEVRTLSGEQDAGFFHVARVSLGALGLLSEVTLQCVDAFRLRAVEQPERIDEVLEGLDEHVDAHDHFEFFWVPHTGWALTKRNDRTGDPPAPRGRLVELRDDWFWTNAVFGLCCRLGRARPDWIPRLQRVLPNRGRVEYVDVGHRVFASPRLVRFLEMEYAIPRAAAAPAVRRVRDWVKRSGIRLSFPVEVRFTAGDDIPLSTAHGRDSAYVAVHVYRGMPWQEYFRAVERIMMDYDGRPHWGKLHFLDAAALAPRYPEWERFQAGRAALDPRGTFANAELDRVLGPPRPGKEVP